MPALKPSHISPSTEEDAAITAAALNDPDALPLTDEDFGSFLPYQELYVPKTHLTWADKNARVTAEGASR